jgi:ABC-type dipeptide/oligopeptide/nickel transport system permease component
MRSALVRFVILRLGRAALLMLAVSSTSLLLVHLAPGDAFSQFEVDPAFAAAERARLGFDRPFVEQYVSWLSRASRLDFGEASRFRRPVRELLRERAGNSALLGCAALVIAIVLGIPAGILTASDPRQWWAAVLRGIALLLVATPPLVTALVLLLAAATTGWLPTGGMDMSSAGGVLAYLPLPALALALPIAASLERMQSTAMHEALNEPCVLAARARGVSANRAVWIHAWRLSLKPIVAVLGIVMGTLLSGSFVVEYVLSWPGLGDLMYQALISRDSYLAAGCAATGAAFLALGIVAADVALVVVDPRTADQR